MLPCRSRRFGAGIRRTTFLISCFCEKIKQNIIDISFSLRTFSLPEFVTEVQEAVRPVLNAYFKVSLEVPKS